MSKQKSKRFRNVKKPKFIGKFTRPPSSKRYCLNCEKYRTFKYNPSVGHSECDFCGGRCAMRKKPEEEKDV